jgi:hypothetical protein
MLDIFQNKSFSRWITVNTRNNNSLSAEIELDIFKETNFSDMAEIFKS